MITSDAISQFKQSMFEAGLAYSGEIIADGTLQRFGIDGDGGTPCWYVFHPDGIPAGCFGCWKRHINQTWCSKEINSLSQSDREGLKRKIEAARKEAEKERQRNQQDAAVECQKIWEKARVVDIDHPYLKRKQVRPIGLRQHGSDLLAPIHNENGELVNLQFISPDGTKRFKSCAKKQGCYFIIGNVRDKIFICEGVATGITVHQASGKGVVIAFDAGNLKPVAEAIRRSYPDKRIIIAGDNDRNSEKNIGLEKARLAAEAVKGEYVVPDFMGGSAAGTDFNDLQCEQNLDQIKDQLDRINEPRLQCLSLREFLSLNIPVRTNIVEPWLPAQGLVMVYAPRGVGKTYFALTLGYAISCGIPCFGWNIPKPCGVLYVDGEMPASTMQERLAKIAASTNTEPQAPFKIITPDLNIGVSLSLSTREGQARIESYLEGIDLIIVDNISTVCSVKENDAEAWTPIQEWALRMRSLGRAVLFIHHAGKGGQQRGTSRREDILDTVISLRRPADYLPTEGAVFEVHFEKSRGFAGGDAQPIQLTLSEEGGVLVWKSETVEQSTYQKVVSLSREGLTPREITEELGLNKSGVSRHLKRAKREGLLT